MMSRMDEMRSLMHQEMHHGGEMMDMGGMMGWMWLWALVALLLLVAVVALVVWAVRRPTGHAGGSDARRILEERFARGEIDTSEFRERSSLLDRR